MTKQVHIHIHRTKARDAGEGEGKWITLSPSGTHVKIDGKGEITAGPKGMTGKKPSELSKGASESPKPIKHATGQGQSFLPTQPKMGHGSVTKTGSGFTAKNHKGFKEYFKPHEEEKAKAYAASGKEDTPHDPTGMAHAGRPQGTAAVQARIDAKKAAGKPVGFANPRSAGAPEKPAAQKYSSKLASLNRLLNNAPSGSEQAKHIQSQIRATQLAQAKEMQARNDAKKAAASKPGPYYGAPLRGIGFSSPSEAQSPRKPENLPAPNPRKILESNKKSMEQLEKLVNNPGTLHSVKYDAKQTLANLRKQNEELERQIAAEMSKPVGFAGKAAASTAKPGPDGKPTALPGVSAFSPPKSTSAQISASMVTYRSNTTGAGTAPKDKSQYGNWLFDSAPGSLADHSRTGGTFAISGTYAEAEQKAKQQAAAWGHSQLRLAP